MFSMFLVQFVSPYRYHAIQVTFLYRLVSGCKFICSSVPPGVSCITFLFVGRRSTSIFLAHANGSFGDDLLRKYVAKLDNFSTIGLAGLRMEAFVGSIVVMGEIWRRFVFERQCFPFKLWDLLGTNTDEEFLQMYRRFQDLKVQCPRCCDIEFSHPVLNMIPRSDDPLDRATLTKLDSLRALLVDLATYAPLSSDITECLHGFTQSKCHRFRGCKPTDDVAQELTLWASIVSGYQKFWEHVWSKFGDYKLNYRLHRYDKVGANQSSSKEASKETKYKKGAAGSVWSSKRNLSDICSSAAKFAKGPKALSGLGFRMYRVSVCVLSSNPQRSRSPICTQVAKENGQSPKA